MQTPLTPARAPRGRPAARRKTTYPLLNFMYEQAAAQGVTLAELARRTGYEQTHLSRLGERGAPSMQLLTACLAVLGFHLVPVPAPVAAAQALAAQQCATR